MTTCSIYHFQEDKIIRLDVGEWRLMVVAEQGVMINKTYAVMMDLIGEIWRVDRTTCGMLFLGNELKLTEYVNSEQPSELAFMNEKFKEFLLFKPDKDFTVDGRLFTLKEISSL